MAQFKDLVAELRRTAILRILFNAPAKTCNSDILKMVLNERGIVTSGEDLNSDIDFLFENRCIEHKYNSDAWELKIVTLTEKGEDVALDRQTVSGVRRPRRGDNLPPISDAERGVL